MSPHLRQGLVTSAAATLAALVGFVLHVDNPWWAAISAFIVSSASREAALSKAALRVAGTVAGCLVGAFLAAALINQPFMQAVVMAFLFAFGVYKRYTADASYAWFLGTITALLVVLLSIANPQDITSFAIDRGTEITLGVLASALVTVLTAARHQEAEPPPAPPPDRGDHIAALQVGLFGAVCLLGIVLFLAELVFPSIIQVVVSAAVILAPTIAKTRETALLRVSGCLVGGVAGLCVAALSIEWLALWMLVFFGGMAACATYHHSRRPNAYIGTQAGIAFIMATITGAGPVDNITPVVERVAAISTTVIIIGVLSVVVAPWVRATPRSPAHPTPQSARNLT